MCQNRLCSLLIICLLSIQLNSQNFTIILGRPTNTSISANIVFDRAVDFSINYGLHQDSLNQVISMPSAKATIPNIVEFKDLISNTRYFYQLNYKFSNNPIFIKSQIFNFHTQRSIGEEFTFTIEADEHLYDKKGHAPLYEICLSNQAKDKPDFMISLGDTFGDDHTPDETTSQDMKELHEDYLKYLGKLTHSVPFFFCLGNHEGENGYYLKQNNGENIAVYGTQWRKYYYPNPFPGTFYSGNMAKETYGIEYPENYYAFTWGDALFVILDVYRHCDINEKPQKWDWTLGEEQYKWFRKVLEESTSKFKFVFAHHTRGQGRGAAVTVSGFEWGGYSNTKYEFDTYRPGWGKPIHEVMQDEGVNIFFQGHDHLFAWEKVDGIVYQEVPMPSDSSYKIGVTDNGDAYTDVILDGSGHLRVNVKPNCVKIDFVRAYLPSDTINGKHRNEEIAYSYKIGECSTSIQDHNSLKRFRVYPNPSQHYAMIEIPEEFQFNNYKLDIIDINGTRINSEVTHMNENTLKINLNTVKPGIYVLRLSENSGNVIFNKLIVR